jgi:hypothetical protein
VINNESDNSDLKIDGVLALQKALSGHSKSTLTTDRKKSVAHSRQSTLKYSNISTFSSINKTVEKSKSKNKEENQSSHRRIFSRPKTTISNYNTTDSQSHHRDKSENLLSGARRRKLQTIHEFRGENNINVDNLMNSTYNQLNINALGSLQKNSSALSVSRKSLEPENLKSIRASLNDIVDFKEMRNRNKLNRQHESSDLSELMKIQRVNINSQSMISSGNSKSLMCLHRVEVAPFAERNENTNVCYESTANILNKQDQSNRDNFETLGLAGKLIMGILESVDCNKSMQLALLDEVKFALESKMKKKKHFKPKKTNLKLRQALKSSSKENTDIKYEIALSHVKDVLKG